MQIIFHAKFSDFPWNYIRLGPECKGYSGRGGVLPALPADPAQEATAGWTPTEAGVKAGGVGLQVSGIWKKSVVDLLFPEQRYADCLKILSPRA
jgi:hypothetical protein